MSIPRGQLRSAFHILRAVKGSWLSVPRIVACTLAVFTMPILAAGADPSSVTPKFAISLAESWAVNFNKGDANAVAALYAPDAQLLLPGNEPIQGIAAIRESVQSLITQNAKVTTKIFDSAASGDVAYVFGAYSVVDAHGKQIDQGRFIEIWRYVKGNWKITRDMNSNGTPPR